MNPLKIEVTEAMREAFETSAESLGAEFEGTGLTPAVVKAALTAAFQHEDTLRQIREQENQWLPIGGGAEYRTDPEWVDPPKILLLFADGERSIAYWDWYYAEDGNGYEPGMSAWVEPVSGEQVARHYGPPIGWRPLPEPPRANLGRLLGEES
jgi:hypothetical protein